MLDEDLQVWLTPFFMANIQHPQRASFEHAAGFLMGRDFVYDEMQITGPARRRGVAGDSRRPTTRWRRQPSRSRARGRRKRSAKTAPTICCFVAIAPDGRQARASVKGDRDPGYGSTSKMIAECAICLLRDTPDVPAGIGRRGRRCSTN